MIIHADKITKEETIVNIGTIEFENIINEESIDKDSPKLGNITCDVFIWVKEGENIPHLHITGKGIDTAIHIYSNYYFLHGPHTSWLTNKQCEDLNKWFKKKNKRGRYKDYTNWEAADLIWRKNFPNPIEFCEEQPDYTKLNENGTKS